MYSIEDLENRKMLPGKGYFDYNVSESCFSIDNAKATIKTLYDFGYRTIAINQAIDDENIEPKKKKKKGETRDVSDIVPVPFDLKQIENIIRNSNIEAFTVLNRLTITFSNQDILYKITKSPNYKRYHIVAVIPTSMSALMFTCGTFEAEILSYNPENKINLKLNRKMYKQLVDRKYHFEILYSPAIQDSTKRKNMLHLSHLYHAYGKSRNIILSSGATYNTLLRSCYDVINLGLIFGLNDVQAKSSISHCGRSVWMRSISRGHGRTPLDVRNVEDDEQMNEASIVLIEDSENEDMDVDQPALKKSKQ